MTVSYSILFVPTIPSIGEKVSVGLFFSNGDQSKIYFSDKKIEIAKELLPQITHQLLDYSIELVRLALKDQAFINSESKPKGEMSIIDDNYIEYLSRYNNNLLVFSKPTIIDIAFTQENFQKLLNKYVRKEEVVYNGV